MLEPEFISWTICHDVYTGVTTVRRIENEGVRRHADHRLETGVGGEQLQHQAERSLSARADIDQTTISREGWTVSSTTRIVMASTETHFTVHATLNAYEKEQLVFNRKWSLEIPRDHV